MNSRLAHQRGAAALDQGTVAIPLRNGREGSQGALVTRPGADRDRVTARLEAAKRSFVTRRVVIETAAGLSRSHSPRAGDLLLASVSEVNQHGRLEQPGGRRAQLYPGDEILVAYGARYAPDQFEAVVPDDLLACDLVAGGGIAGRMIARHARMKKATTILPIGLLVDASGLPVNLARFALQPVTTRRFSRNVIAVVGTSMNAGKTTLAAHVIRGLARGGVRVGACKVTGTGSGGDLWSMIDAGAVCAMDFTDAGLATTAGLAAHEVDAVAKLLVSHVEAADVDAVVVEIADGLLQRETSALLSTPSTFCSRVDSILLAAADSLGAAGAAHWLTSRNLPLRAISGLVGASPLASREVEQATGFAVLRSEQFGEGELAARICLQKGPSASIPRAGS